MTINISSCSQKEIGTSLILPTLLLDCRVMQDPYGVLREDGSSKRVQDWVRQRYPELIQAFLTQILASLKPLSGIRGIGGNLSVTCFCFAGICRSRAMKHILAQELIKPGIMPAFVKEVRIK